MKKNKVYRRVLALSDCHAPFVDMAFLKDIHKFSKSFKPDLIIIPGDVLDQKAWSRYIKDTDDLSPSDELEMAIECTAVMHDMFPNAHVKIGNHDLRILKKLQEQGIPTRVLKEFNELFETPTWTWHTNPKDQMIFNTPKGKVLVRHGDESRHRAINLASMLGVNVIQGHTHKPELLYQNALGQTNWAMTLGHTMDVDSKAARYAFANPIGTTPAFGVIEDGHPRIITK